MSASSKQSIDQLRQENARLLALIGQQEQTIALQKTSIDTLKHQLILFRSARFGRTSEKSVVAEQLTIQFDEAVPTSLPEFVSEEDKPGTETITYTRNKKNTGRRVLPQSLPYIEYIHDLPESQKQCSCGCALTHIKDEVTEQLDIVPQMTFRVVHVRKKYACRTCEDTILLAPLPSQPIPKSIATPGLLAAIIDNKFNRHTPLYRQEGMFHEAGISITRGTLSNWVIKAADLMTPLVKLMEADIHDYDIAYADETTLQVLNEKNRAPTQKSYMWLFMGGPPDKRACVYQYHPTRAHKIAFDFFADFSGFVHADCYKAYVALGQLEHIQHVACWAHARRYFMDVLKITKKEGLAQRIVKLIASLYHLEKQLKEQEASIAVIFNQRLKVAKPVLNQIKTLLDEATMKVPPKSPLGTAVFYSLNHWESLLCYLYDGRLEIDNNRSERSIKPFVIGRKNWMFHGNDIGAKAGSVLFSIIETCKQNKVEVFSYLKYVLANIHQAQSMEQLEQLLPYNINPLLLQSMRSLPELISPVKGVVN